MLKPNIDRINYSQSLIPPEGYKLGYAICTTYSLNMETLISVLLALGYEISSPETSTNSESIAAFLNIIEKLSDKVLFFCETGKIDIPNINHNLHILLERMIVPVALKSKNNYYPAFHPKTWFLKFIPDREEEPFIYRTIILSRNLTYDKNLDICICFDGKKTNFLIDKSKPLIRFFSFLLEFATRKNTPNQAILLEALDEFHYIDFNIEDCFDYNFILNGVDEEDIKKDKLFLSTKVPNRLFIMSPFINKGFFSGIKINAKGVNDKPNILIARRNEVYQNISKELFDCFDVYDLKQISDIESTQADATSNQDINKYNGFHAKILGTYDGENTSIYMGSMNTTTAARDYNVEMIVRLDYEGNKLDEVIEELIPEDEKKCIFEQIYYQNQPETEEQKKEREAEKLLKVIARLNLKAELIDTEGDKFKVRISRNKNEEEDILDYSDEFSVKIQCVTTKEEQDFILHKELTGIVEFSYNYSYEISELFRIKICNYNNEEIKSGIISIHINGLEKLSRQKELINNILQDSSILFNSLQMIFERNNNSFFDELLNSEDEYGERNTNNKKYSVSELEIYEKILKSCFNDYDSILEFLRLLDKVDISKLENGNSLLSLKKALIKFDKVTKNEYNKMQTK